MNPKCKVTIFITTYNRIKYLKPAIESILNQTFSDFTLTVLDNCSEDGTEEYVKSITDNGVNYFRHEHNIGGIANVAYAFEHCSGEYFAIFHDDDILHDDLLAREVAYLDEHKECTAVSCLANNIDENGKYTKRISEEKCEERTFCNGQFFYEYLNRQKSFTFPATLYRTSFIKSKNINVSAASGPCNDVVLYMDIEKNGGTIAEVPKALIDYRVYKNQDSSAHLEEMLIKLIHFLANDEYYGKLIEKDESGRIKYYKWYFRRLIARETSKCISYEAASLYLDKMYQELNLSDNSNNRYRKLLKTADTFSGAASLAYKFIKRVKS